MSNWVFFDSTFTLNNAYSLVNSKRATRRAVVMRRKLINKIYKAIDKFKGEFDLTENGNSVLRFNIDYKVDKKDYHLFSHYSEYGMVTISARFKNEENIGNRIGLLFEKIWYESNLFDIRSGVYSVKDFKHGTVAQTYTESRVIYNWTMDSLREYLEDDCLIQGNLKIQAYPELVFTLGKDKYSEDYVLNNLNEFNSKLREHRTNVKIVV